jgi:hypothetical protein
MSLATSSQHLPHGLRQRSDLARRGARRCRLAGESTGSDTVSEHDALRDFGAQRSERLVGQRRARLPMTVPTTRRLITKAARSCGRNTLASITSCTISWLAHTS